MKHLLTIASLLTVLAATDMPAQTQKRVFLSDGNAAAGGANTFPWSREGLRYQTIFPSAKFSTSGVGVFIINDILVAPQLRISPAIKTAVYDDIEIRMGPTAQVVPTTNWATNNPKPTTVYRGPLRVTFEKGKWRGLGLPKAYLFLQLPAAPNLCVEFIMWKFNAGRRLETTSIRTVTAPSPTRRAFYYKWTTAQTTPPSTGTSAAKMGLILGSGNFVPTETGCRSSNNTILSIGASTFPQVGKNMDITLAGGLPNSPAFLAIGFSDTLGYGGVLPIDGRILGAPNCFIWNVDSFLVGTAVDSTGSAKLTFKIPSGLGNARAYVHWWNLDKNANVLGGTTSNYGKLLLGL